MKKLLLILYAIPYVFCGMYCQWVDFGLWMTILTGLTFIPPVVYAYLCAKNGCKTIFLFGNMITFITSLLLTWVLNFIQLTSETGMSWYGAFKPFNSIQMVVFCSVVSFLMQVIIYKLAKRK